MSIPKIIHYCWFGSNELPEVEKKCLKSWTDKLPDYKILFWNEENSNLSECEYVQQAYENKKYAFVSDYIRIKALYEYGGIYLDTDVEVLKSFNSLLDQKGFLGFENRTYVGTAIMAFEKGADIAKQMLDYYHSHSFISFNGTQNLTTNVTILNAILEAKGMIRQNRYQIVDNIHIYEREFFFPKKLSETEFAVTDKSVTIHRMSATWLTKRQKKRGSNKLWINVCRPVLRKALNITQTIFGEDKSRIIELKIRNLIK